MSNLSTQLKTWGAQGSEYPDGYQYLEDEEPVDAWDNFAAYHTIENIKSLIETVNGRLETEAGASNPSTPEVGHLVHRTDAPENGAHEELYYYDGASAQFNRLMRADGDTMSGDIDMGGHNITDSDGRVSVSSALSVDGGNLDHDWFNKQEGGSVAAGSVVPIGTFGIEDGETIQVTQAMLTEDGFTTPAASGIDLVIADENAVQGDDTTVTTILSGDGATHYDNETGESLASYTNTSGGHLTVIIGVDNGYYTSGVGSNTEAHAGFIARVE